MSDDRTASPGRQPVDRAERTQALEPKRPAPVPVPETGGPKGPEPTRYGDWEKGGRCTDF